MIRLTLLSLVPVAPAQHYGMSLAPLWVFLAGIVGHPMTLVFHTPLDLFAIAATAFIVNAITSDGETTWFEGVMLIGVYAVFGIAFFFA